MHKRLATTFGVIALGVFGGNAVAQPAQMPAPKDAGAQPQVVMHHNNGCCKDGCGGGAYADVGALLLKPRWDNNPAFSTTTNAEGEVPSPINTTTHFDPDFRFCPRVTLGWDGGENGMGFRTRWFHAEFGTSISATDNDGAEGATNAISTPGIGSTGFRSYGSVDNPSFLEFTGNIRLTVWDIEATKVVMLGDLRVDLAAGLRYLHLSQNYGAFENFPTATQDLSPLGQAIISGHNINAFGPSIALETRYPLGGGLSFYAGGRLALLWAKGKQTAVYGFIDNPGEFGGVLGLQQSLFHSERNNMVPVTDLELGAEWTSDIGNSKFFVNGALVSQVYHNVGGTLRAGNLSDQSNANLGLFGFALTTGIRY